MLVIVVIAGSILGYGYWHSSTHASFYVDIHFKGIDGSKKYAPPTMNVKFLDSEGTFLAEGISDEQYNFIHLIHPKVGDCHEIEKMAHSSIEARTSWQECFEYQSAWIPKWVRDVTHVEVNYGNCLFQNIPISVSENNSSWYLWYIPLPHVGGNPYSYYSTIITIDEKTCNDKNV